MIHSRKWLILASVLVVMSLLLAACGGEAPAATATPEPTAAEAAEDTPEATEEGAETPEEAAEATEGEPAEDGPIPTAVPGDGPTPIPFDIAAEFRVNGASSVYDISQAVARRFVEDYPNVEVTVGVAGTAGGFRRFCEGSTFFNNAERPMLESEAERCAENGVEWIELLLGYQGVVLAAHPDTDFAACLTTDQLATMWSLDAEPSPEVEATPEEAETGGEGGEGEDGGEAAALPEPNPGITNWNEVAPDFPDLELLLFGDSPNSAVADLFSSEAVGTAGDIRTDYTGSTNYQVLVDEMVGKPGSLGFFDFSYYDLNEEALVLVEIDAGDGCVAPSAETITDGSYPLARPVYLYAAAEQLDNPAVFAFVDFYLSDAGLEEVVNNGFFPASEAAYAQDRDAIADRVLGRQFAEAPPEPEPVVTATPTAEPTEEAEAEAGEDTGEATSEPTDTDEGADEGAEDGADEDPGDAEDADTSND